MRFLGNPTNAAASWASVEGITALPRFHLDEFPNQVQAFGSGKADYSHPLGFDPKP